MSARLASSGLALSALVATLCLVGCAAPAPLATPVASANRTASATQAGTQSAAQPASPATSTGAPSLTQPTAVDAQSYREAPTGNQLRYAFVSPSGAIYCAISDGLHTFAETGCQGDFVVPTLPKCDAPASNAPMVRFVDGVVRSECTTQGVFVGEKPQKVLPYGSSLTAMGYTCTSQTTGVTCTKTATGQSFTIAKEAITIKG